MNPFFFEIVRSRSDRYYWQLVTYLGGDREVIARSSRDWRSSRRARKAAKATKNAACSARVVMSPPRPGDIRFEVLRDVLALDVTGDGDFAYGNGRHSAPHTTGGDYAASRGEATGTGTASPVRAASEATSATPPAGNGSGRTGDGPGAAGTAAGRRSPASNAETAETAEPVTAGSAARGTRPKAPPRKTATRTGAAARRN